MREQGKGSGVAAGRPELRARVPSAKLPAAHYGFPGSEIVHWFGVLFATIGAGAVLGALTFVSLLVGALINLMIVLFAGPVVDRVLARRQH